MSRQDVVRKVTALLRLAERGGTAAEAAVAAAKAQELMDRYEIEQESLRMEGSDAADPDEDVVSFYERPDGELDASGIRLEDWRWMLAGSLARHNGCFIFTSRRVKNGKHCRTVEIVGRPSAVEAVRYMHAWLFKELARLADQHGKGMGQKWRREFRVGFAQELGKRLAQQRQATEDDARRSANSGHALVVVEKALAKVAEHRREARRYAYERHNLRSAGRSFSGQIDQGARAAGASAARSVDLGSRRRQIGGGT